MKMADLDKVREIRLRLHHLDALLTSNAMYIYQGNQSPSGGSNAYPLERMVSRERHPEMHAAMTSIVTNERKRLVQQLLDLGVEL